MTAQALIAPDHAWMDVGSPEDVPLRGSRCVATPTGDIAIFKAGDGSLFALRDLCPHKKGPLSQGIVHGHSVTCPLHNWVIDLKTGHPTGADAGKACTPTVPVLVEQGRIFIPAER
ncbi:nitrite reductase small subunit NirD [Phenylobacterium sp.]|uniref:nitrite reductase small subunit NirD n=1 Tax=Phenylobacterium sp. TaxID=1871053 RepID=UPI0035B0F95B